MQANFYEKAMNTPPPALRPEQFPMLQIVLYIVSKVHSSAYIRHCYYPQPNFVIMEFYEVQLRSVAGW